MKIVWKVSPAPTGKYRSFEKRGWPSAYIGAHLIASVSAADGHDYSPRLVRENSHGPLYLVVYDYSLGVQHRKARRVKQMYASLAGLKESLPKLLAIHPDFILKEEVKS